MDNIFDLKPTCDSKNTYTHKSVPFERLKSKDGFVEKYLFLRSKYRIVVPLSGRGKNRTNTKGRIVEGVCDFL